MRLVLRIVLIALVIAVAVVLVVAGGFAVWNKVTGRLSFESTVWKRDSLQTVVQARGDRKNATRDRMVDDLLGRYRLGGMEKREVTTLLGDPDFTNREPFKDWDIIYWLGPDSRSYFGGLDSMWLVLKVDSTGRVTDFKVTVD
jgi:hypothetical protein